MRVFERRISPLGAALMAGVSFIAASVHEVLAAPDQIGVAVTVRNDVSQIEPTLSKILAGDDIVRNAVVRTLNNSGAKFVLKDSTNLILGPNSNLKLDQAVFTDEKTIGDIAIKLSAGSFRFMTYIIQITNILHIFYYSNWACEKCV